MRKIFENDSVVIYFEEKRPQPEADAPKPAVGSCTCTNDSKTWIECKGAVCKCGVGRYHKGESHCLECSKR